MKKWQIIFLMVLLVIPITTPYSYKGIEGYSLNSDFANGGVQANSGSYNTSSIIGESMTPFNGTSSEYRISQRLYSIIGSDSILLPPEAVLAFTFFIEDFGIEWIKLNWV